MSRLISGNKNHALKIKIDFVVITVFFELFFQFLLEVILENCLSVDCLHKSFLQENIFQFALDKKNFSSSM